MNSEQVSANAKNANGSTLLFAGAGMLILGFIIWEARGYLPALAAKRLGIAVSVGMVLLFLGGQFLVVIGSHRLGVPRVPLLLRLLIPISTVLCLDAGIRMRLSLSDFELALVLSAVTVAPWLYALRLTRSSEETRMKAGIPQRNFILRMLDLLNNKP